MSNIKTGVERIFFFQAEDGIRDYKVTGVQTCALPIYRVDMIHRHSAKHSAQDLAGGYNSGREVQANQLRVRSALCGGGIMAVGDQDFGVMTGAREHFVDFRMNQLML